MSQIIKALERAKHEELGNPFANRKQNGDSRIDFANTQKINVNTALLKQNHVLTAIQNQQYIEAYKILRTRVMSRMQQNRWSTLGVTSSCQSEGKTLTSTNLAISIAMKLNYSVVLVDADLRRPSLHKLLGIKPRYGLIDYLESKVSLEKAFIATPGIDNLVMLPGKRSASNRLSEHLSSPKMDRLVKELKSRYSSRIVIFDLPPVLAGDDVMGFVPHIDTTLLVVEDNKSQADELMRSIELLEGTNIIGTVLNKSTESNNAYSYY